MTEATIATKVHKTLDVHRYFPTQVAFNSVLTDFVAQFVKLSIAEILDLLGWLNGSSSTNRISASAADTEDSLKADHSMLMIRYVNPSNTGHTFLPQVKKVANSNT